MIRFIRTRATYANVMATVALFLSLSGVGMATHLVVRSSDIKDNQVKSIDVRDDDLRDGGLHGWDIASNTLTGADINELSLERSCPHGMAPVSSDLCYDSSERRNQDFPTALRICSDAGLRLPSLAEAFEARPAWPDSLLYWTGEPIYSGAAEHRAWTYSAAPSFWTHEFSALLAFRCVATRV